MPTGRIPEVVLQEVRYRDYWEKSYTLWGNTETWDSYFQENVQEATRLSSHNALSADLKILIRKLKSGTKARWKALAMQHDLKNVWSLQRAVNQDMHCCVLHPSLLVLGKKSVWSLHHCNVLLTKICTGICYTLTAGVGEEECLKRNSLSNNLPIFDDDIEDEDSSIEKLTFEPHITKLPLPYRRVLEEMII
ncbi:9283_t:CDS:2 [Funneliformis caledonium]|uniref:9283_t:CDS:1 n=1 Tax=Funneliformis caledonium TaxID=1117310 RepID=A0A9N9EC77_9GLOM|nr:9283_t:CDS:2 [Funneliformis caledonium]